MKIEPNVWLSEERRGDAGKTVVGGYRVTDVTFSERDDCPSFILANISPRFDVGYNLSRIESIVQVAHEVGADILVLPELCISGYVWDADHRAEVQEQLKASDNSQPDVRRVLDRVNAGLAARSYSSTGGAISDLCWMPVVGGWE